MSSPNILNFVPSAAFKNAVAKCMELLSEKNENLRLNEHQTTQKYYCHELLHESDFCVPTAKSIKEKAGKSKEQLQFEEHLLQLRSKQDQREYEKLTTYHADNAKAGTGHVGKDFAEAFKESTQALHLIIVLVGSFFVFYYLSHHFFQHTPGMNIVCGCVGLLLGVLVDIFLLIARQEKEERSAKKTPQKKEVIHKLKTS
ncbi:hypothetical protein RFI_06319 [Reticulomyxa filosa]|uniref:Endoplasmic reticulum-based factor for assembly of V-ATPase n=1 Tax=Reticulomyxa filosa TaxID=46433 RepID=X6NY36_RETFI|nr:hypothetical protein RFI_06319 [Reticulomyxa filosa]|eukprot:ETO30793.1 hypothetical protein RFI_06319 [Reticulomyxa filosa]